MNDRTGAAGAPRSGMTGTQRLRFTLAATLAGVYFVLVLVMALFPAGLAATLDDAGTVSVGMIASLVMILLVFVVMGAFVRWIDRRMAGRS